MLLIRRAFLLLLMACMVLSATAGTDTTAARISGIKDDTLRAISWYRAGFKYLYSDTAKSLRYAKECLKISEKVRYTNGMIAYYHLMGEFADRTGEYDKAIDFFNRSLAICLEIGDKKSAAKRYNNLAGIYNHKGNYKASVEYYLKSIKAAEEVGHKQGMAYSYIGLGNIFQQQHNEEKALEYFNSGLKLSEEIKDLRGMLSALNNIGDSYFRQKQYSKAMVNFVKAAEMLKELEDMSGLARSYDRMASVYGSVGDHDKAHELFNKSLKIFEDLGDRENIAIAHTNLGEQYFKERKYQKAKEHYLISLKIAKEVGYTLLIQHDYKELARTLEKQNDFRNAYHYHQLYTQVKDSVINQESAKQVAEMETKYESEKKALQIRNLKNEKALQQSEIAKQTEEVKRQNTQKMAFAGGFMLMMVLAVVVYRGYAHKKKANGIILEQKQEVESQKSIIEEKHKEITDSINYARRIQSALLSKEEDWGKVGKEHFILFKPKDIVSGDFYWCCHTPEKAFWVVADCTGHGVPGAFMSMLGISFMDEVIDNHGIREADKVLNSLREKVIRALEQKGMRTQQQDGMDLSLCILDKKTRMLDFAGANNSIYIIRDKRIMELQPDKMPIGRYTESLEPFHSQHLQLQENDVLISYTDGYADQFGGEKGKKFRYKQFEDLLTGSSDRPMNEMRSLLDATFEKWKGAYEQIDDVCIVGVRI